MSSSHLPSKTKVGKAMALAMKPFQPSSFKSRSHRMPALGPLVLGLVSRTSTNTGMSTNSSTDTDTDMSICTDDMSTCANLGDASVIGSIKDEDPDDLDTRYGTDTEIVVEAVFCAATNIPAHETGTKGVPPYQEDQSAATAQADVQNDDSTVETDVGARVHTGIRVCEAANNNAALKRANASFTSRQIATLARLLPKFDPSLLIPRFRTPLPPHEPLRGVRIRHALRRRLYRLLPASRLLEPDVYVDAPDGLPKEVEPWRNDPLPYFGPFRLVKHGMLLVVVQDSDRDRYRDTICYACWRDHMRDVQVVWCPAPTPAPTPTAMTIRSAITTLAASVRASGTLVVIDGCYPERRQAGEDGREQLALWEYYSWSLLLFMTMTFPFSYRLWGQLLEIVIMETISWYIKVKKNWA